MMFRWLIYAGLLLYLSSLLLPVIEKKNNTDIRGYEALELSFRHGTGYVGLLVEASVREAGDEAATSVRSLYFRWLSWAWLANLGVVFGIIVLFVRSREGLRLLGVLGSGCALLAVAGFLIPLFSGVMPEYGLGYWTWLWALGTLSAGAFVAARALPAPTRHGQGGGR